MRGRPNYLPYCISFLFTCLRLLIVLFFSLFVVVVVVVFFLFCIKEKINTNMI